MVDSWNPGNPDTNRRYRMGEVYDAVLDSALARARIAILGIGRTPQFRGG